MKRSFFIIMLCLSAFWSCQKPAVVSETTTSASTEVINTTMSQDKTSVDDADTVAVKVKMKEHSVHLVMRQEDISQSSLSPASVKELENWWDSLPKPLQNQIKSNQVEIELTTNVRSPNEKDIAPEVTDPQIENTGAELERIIGTSADMTFTVNTTLVSTAETAEASEHSTNITLVKKVPMKLKAFDFEIYLDQKGAVTNENVQSLQYWWMRLPDNLKEKIQKREVVVHLTCVAIDKEMDKSVVNLGGDSEDYLMIMSDVLQQMMGRYSIGKESYPLGQINQKSVIESIQTVEPVRDADYLIRIQLQNNKAMIHLPAM